MSTKSESTIASSTISTKKKRNLFSTINPMRRFRKNKTDKAVESELSGSLSNQPIETHQYTSVNQSAARYSSVNQSTSSSASTCSSKFSQGDAKAVKKSNLSSKLSVSASSLESASNSSQHSQTECPLCLTSLSAEKFYKLQTCSHLSCVECLRQYIVIEITESRVNVTCPECQERINPHDLRKILGEDHVKMMEKYESFMLRKVLSVDPDCRWCPAPDCGYAVIAHGCASCPKLKCEKPGCNTNFCYHCRQEWHPDQTCDAAHLQRTRQIRVIRNNSISCSQEEMKPCPKCGALIVKMNDGSCNHMTCSVCDAEFCWLCLQEITDLHYLSPSGCTFWGKKPWSRKKKILWQLGLLIGAPVGIALVAGVAVPAIIIGLPFWVARKTLSQLKKKRKKRNMIVAGCVAGSIILSPPLAALAVGIGVPVMLVYVYGVVPISLCRTGNQNNPATSSQLDPLKLQRGFDALVVRGNGGSSSGGAPRSDQPQASSGAKKKNSASSKERISGGGGVSQYSMSEGGSSSNINNSHKFPDHETSSTQAIAGSSITGSISTSISGMQPASSNQ